MPAVFRRRISHRVCAALAGFVFGVSLAAAVGWAAVSAKPRAVFGHTEYTKL